MVFMSKILSNDNLIKTYFDKIFVSYFLLIFFSIFNGLFEFTLENKRFYFGYLFEFYFLIISIICYFLAYKCSFNLPFSNYKKIFLSNYIVFPLYIVLTFIYNYIFHIYNRGISINLLYILIFLIILIFMMFFNYNYSRKLLIKKEKINLDIINYFVIGINDNIYNNNDLQKIKRLFNIIEYYFIFVMGLISLLIMQKNLISFIVTLISISIFIILLIIFIIKNNKIKLFNYKFFISFTIYYLIIAMIFILNAYMYNIASNFDNINFTFIFAFMFFY